MMMCPFPHAWHFVWVAHLDPRLWRKPSAMLLGPAGCRRCRRMWWGTVAFGKQPRGATPSFPSPWEGALKQVLSLWVSEPVITLPVTHKRLWARAPQLLLLDSDSQEMCEVTFVALSFVVICHAAVDEYNKHSRNVTRSIYLLSAVLSLFEVLSPPIFSLESHKTP